RVKVGAVPLAHPEAIRDVAESPARNRLVVLHVGEDPIVEGACARHHGVFAGRLARRDGADLVVHLYRSRAVVELRGVTTRSMSPIAACLAAGSARTSRRATVAVCVSVTGPAGSVTRRYATRSPDPR